MLLRRLLSLRLLLLLLSCSKLCQCPKLRVQLGQASGVFGILVRLRPIDPTWATFGPRR